MSETRKSYEEALLKLMGRASVRELHLLWVFARAFLGECKGVS